MSGTKSKSASTVYELVVQNLLQTRLKEDGFANLATYHLKKYKGKSGQEHEIDVSFEVTIGELNLLIFVECKHYKRKVGVDDVTTFVYRLRDAGAHKGIVVTTVGFQKGVHRVAKAEGVALLVAASGRVHHYAGLGPTTFLLWVNRLVLNTDKSSQLTILGERRRAMNVSQAFVRPLDEAEAIDLRSIVFLSPEEHKRGADFESWQYMRDRNEQDAFRVILGP